MIVAKIKRDGRSASAVIVDETARLIGPWERQLPIIAGFDAPSLSLDELRSLSHLATEVVPLAGVGLARPAGPMSKLICLGLNYRNHVEETLNDVPENPALFTKIADVLVGQAEPIIRPKVSTHFDYEGEITVIIGRAGRHIVREEALSHVFGYTIMLDGSVRDYQKHSASAGKNFWHSGSLGPWIRTADEIPDPSALTLETRLNGQTVQSATADLMLYDIPSAISYISRWTPLAPGDVIAMGTPGGVGAQRTPPLWMKHGDTIEVEVSSIGVLRNSVKDEE